MQLSRSNGRPNSFHCSILYYSVLSYSDPTHMRLFSCDPPQNILHFYLLFETQSQITTEWNSLGLITLMSSSLHKVLQGGLPHNVDTLREHLQEGDFTQRCAGHALFLHIQPRFLESHQAPRFLVPRFVNFAVSSLADLLQLLVVLHRGTERSRSPGDIDTARDALLHGCVVTMNAQ